MNDVPKPWLTAPHFVYALHAADGTCLYVGCTINIVQRLKQHSVKAWWSEVALIEASSYADQASGRAAEKELIHLLNPAHNTAMTDHDQNDRWATRLAKAEERHQQGDLCQPGTQCKHCNAIYRANGVAAHQLVGEELRRRLATANLRPRPTGMAAGEARVTPRAWGAPAGMAPLPGRALHSSPP